MTKLKAVNRYSFHSAPWYRAAALRLLNKAHAQIAQRAYTDLPRHSKRCTCTITQANLDPSRQVPVAMKINWDEDAALKLNTIAFSTVAVGHLVVSKEASELLYPAAVPRAPMMHSGNAAAFGAAACAVAADSVDRSHKRKLCKLAGLAHVASSATHLWAWRTGAEKRDRALAAAGISGALAAASFAAGCRNHVSL